MQQPRAADGNLELDRHAATRRRTHRIWDPRPAVTTAAAPPRLHTHVGTTCNRAGLSERGALTRFGCHGECGAQAYKGGLWRSPKRCSRGHSPPVEGQGALQSRS